MVAERLLDLRRPNFSLPSVRAPSTMASPMVMPVHNFLQPPLMDTTTLNEYVQMGAAGAIVVQAVMIAGGRVVQGIWNWASNKMQLLYDENGNLIDFPTRPRQQVDLEEDKPTTPRPPTTTAQMVTDNDDSNDNVQQAMSSFVQGLTNTRRATGTVSIHSQSPETPVTALFQEPTNDNGDEQQRADVRAKTERDRFEKGK